MIPAPTSTLLRIAALAAANLAAAIAAQSTLPATPPTSATSQTSPIAATPTDESTTKKNLPHRATVTYAAGLLDVRADNSSLNQILRQIARLTGMTITGGVTDQRVFGNYGPAEPSTILATLLDGTGSNMLLREGPNSTLAELILTPRNGGATPPNPSAPGFDDGPEEQDDREGAARANQPPPPRGFPGEAQRPFAQQLAPTQSQSQAQSQPQAPTQPLAVPSGPVSIPLPSNNVNGSDTNTSPTASTYPTTNSVPIDSVPTPSTTASTTGIVDAPNPPPASSTTGAAATPESIFQQLQQLQKQNQPKTTPPPPPQSTPPPSTPQ